VIDDVAVLSTIHYCCLTSPVVGAGVIMLSIPFPFWVVAVLLSRKAVSVEVNNIASLPSLGKRTTL